MKGEDGAYLVGPGKVNSGKQLQVNRFFAIYMEVSQWYLSRGNIQHLKYNNLFEVEKKGV